MVSDATKQMMDRARGTFDALSHPNSSPELTEVERLAQEATEARFALRLATEDQRNGYEVGWAEGYTTALSSKNELPSEIRRVVHELRLSERVFHDYGLQHESKAQECEHGGFERDSRLAKAKRNYDRAAACKAALDAFDAALNPKDTGNGK